MDLSRNKLTNAGIRNSAFLAFRSLVNLDLSFNKFESFPKDLSSSIEDIRLNNNRIKYVTTGVFRFPAKIHHLNMRGNKLKETSFSYQSWANMDKLIFLDLSENNLLFVPGVLPRSLSILLLESNNIENILEWSFSSVPKITQIRLSFNNIRHIDPAAFASLQNLQYLDLAHNQLLHYPSNMPINLQAIFVEFNAISNVHGDAFCPAYAQTTFQRSKLNMIVLIGNPVNRRSLFSAGSYCLSSPEVLVFD
ncbi:osteomodulin-like [Clavelina lepadiformis]|uniref:osteomodulin-like n=1 Tax=Clavelina lepadiformis TaxID=159417 RepID=UPI0040424385